MGNLTPVQHKKLAEGYGCARHESFYLKVHFYFREEKPIKFSVLKVRLSAKYTSAPKIFFIEGYLKLLHTPFKYL